METLKDKIKQLLIDEGVDIMHHNTDVIEFGIAAYNMAAAEKQAEIDELKEQIGHYEADEYNRQQE